MTVRDYIGEKLRPLGIGEAQFADVAISLGVPLEEEYCSDNQRDVNIAMIGAISDLILAPRMESVNESGFSMTWNYADLGKWYMHLCSKWDVKPDEELVSLLGINAIIDRTYCW